VGRNDDLHALSGELPAYRGGFVVAEIDAHLDLVRFVNGVELTAGDAVGDLTEEALRRIQIREAIRAHLEKEQALFARGVKVLTLFFIDEVARYRRYDDTGEQPQQDFSSAVRAERHVFDYVFTDSKGEQDFVRQLDSCTEVVVYAKLPRGFFIPTPVGNYNPDWAIAFQEGAVKHVYFVAETKGSMSSLQLREIEQRKIDCARRFFSRITSEQVRYDVVDGYDELLTLVQ
jgi:restriction endonuclease